MTAPDTPPGNHKPGGTRPRHPGRRQVQRLSLLALPQATGPQASVPDLASYDILLASISGGKDSQTMLRVLVKAATAAGVPLSRIVCVFADVGADDEWPATAQIAAGHAATYGLRFITVCRTITDPVTGHRRQQGLLEYIAHRGLWPDSRNRFCTVICTNPVSSIIALRVTIKEAEVDLRRQLMEGRAAIPRVGSVAQVARSQLPFVVLADNGTEVEPVSPEIPMIAVNAAIMLAKRRLASARTSSRRPWNISVAAASLSGKTGDPPSWMAASSPTHLVISLATAAAGSYSSAPASG